jgi:hypothetical protein
MLPKDFAPFTNVQGYFYDWRDDGLFEKINFALLLEVREAAGRELPKHSATVAENLFWTRRNEYRPLSKNDRFPSVRRILLSPSNNLPEFRLYPPIALRQTEYAAVQPPLFQQ